MQFFWAAIFCFAPVLRKEERGEYKLVPINPLLPLQEERWGDLIRFGKAPSDILNYERKDYKDVSTFDKGSFLNGENLSQFYEPLYARDDCESCVGLPLPKFSKIKFDHFQLEIVPSEMTLHYACVQRIYYKGKDIDELREEIRKEIQKE